MGAIAGDVYRLEKKRRGRLEKGNEKVKETVLFINFQDREKLRKVKYAMIPLKMRMVQVKKEAYSQTIGYLAGLKDMEENPEKYAGEELEQEMMIFAGLSNQRLDELLKAMRKVGVRVDYKAILTETNCTWTVPELYKELVSEHESMKKLRMEEQR